MMTVEAPRPTTRAPWPVASRRTPVKMIAVTLVLATTTGCAALPNVRVLELPQRTGYAGATGAAGPEEAAAAPTAAQLLKSVRETSGLTWDQIARALGVSRRAIHHWTNGDRMSAHNIEQLVALNALVTSVPGDDPDSKRAALLLPGPDGDSQFDVFRREVAQGGVDVNALPAPQQALLGAVRT